LNRFGWNEHANTSHYNMTMLA